MPPIGTTLETLQVLISTVGLGASLVEFRAVLILWWADHQTDRQRAITREYLIRLLAHLSVHLAILISASRMLLYVPDAPSDMPYYFDVVFRKAAMTWIALIATTAILALRMTRLKLWRH